MCGLVRPCQFHRYHRHKGRHLIGRQRELAILGRSDPVRQMLRSEIMLPRHIRYHRARCDRLGNNPPLLLIAPPSAADNARYFRVAPNNLRVVTNVDHNVHTILDPKESRSCTARSHSAMWGKSTANEQTKRLAKKFGAKKTS